MIMAHRYLGPIGSYSADATSPRRRAERQPLACGALALRVGHTAIAVVELGCLGCVWTCALTGRRDRLLHGAISVLAAEGVGLGIALALRPVRRSAC